MKKLGKLLALVLVFGFVLAVFAGCQPAETNNGGGGDEKLEDATITALVWMPDNPDIPIAVAEEFNKTYPNITIETLMMSDSITQMLQPKMASNAMPDFFSLSNGFFAEEVADGGYLLDVGDTVSWDVMLDSLKPEWISAGGVKYGVAGGLCTTLFYYNEDLLKEAGVDGIPDNYDDFLVMCKKLKDAGIIPMVYPGGDPNSISNCQYSYGLANFVLKGDSTVANGIKDGSYEIPEEDLTRVYERCVDAVELGYVNDGYMSTDYNAYMQEFLDGDVAILFGGTWLAGSLITEELTFELGCALPPWNDKGETLVPCLSSETGFAIGKTGDAAKEAAAEAYFDFWSEEGFALYQNPRGLVPSIKSDKIIGEINLDSRVSAVMDAAAALPAASSLHFVYMPAVLDGSKSIFQDILAGNLTPATAAAEALSLIKNK